MISTLRFTETTSLPAGTETTSLPARTETATSIVRTTLPASTVSPITETTIQYITSTLPRQTDMITYTSVQPAVSLQRLGIIKNRLTYTASGNKLHHSYLYAAATNYDHGFYTLSIDGRQYRLQHDSTTDFHRACDEHVAARDTNHRLHTSSGHNNRIFDLTSLNSSQHSYFNSSGSNEHAGAFTSRPKILWKL